MNHRGGWALIKSTWFSWMQYRSFFFVLAFGWMVPPLVAMLVWLAAAGDGSLGGMNRAEFVAYYLILMLVNQFTYAQTNWTVGDVIRGGGLSHWLIRPISPLYQILSSEIAGKIVYLVFTIPVAFLLALLLRPQMQTSPSGGIFFVVALIFAWALRFLWGLWLALLAFWITRADSLLALQDSLVFILSGMIAPVALLPDFLQTAAKILPFYYMVGFPVEILTLSVREAALGLLVQGAWLLAAAVLTVVMWRTGLRRYSAIGG
jgi:ABC-2 type transport system permease protein